MEVSVRKRHGASRNSSVHAVRGADAGQGRLPAPIGRGPTKGHVAVQLACTTRTRPGPRDREGRQRRERPRSVALDGGRVRAQAGRALGADVAGDLEANVDV
eukprot:14630407-Heterocapsa_arctica.AAC.1